MYVAVKGGERAIDNAHGWLAEARRGDPAVPEIIARADRRPARPGGGPRDGRRLALRPRTGGAGDQAGAGRPDRGDLPAARLSHHAAALRRIARRSTPRAWRWSAASPPPSRTCPAGRCSARPSTTPTACWISPWRRRARAGQAGRRPGLPKSRCRACSDLLDHEGLIEPPAQIRRRRTRRPDPRDRWSFPADRDVRLQAWRAATKGSCWRWAIPPSAATAARIPSPARSGSARWRWNMSRRNWASPSRSARSRVTECQMVNQFKGSTTAAAAVHPRLWPGVRPWRAQGHGHGPGRPRAAGRGTGRGR